MKNNRENKPTTDFWIGNKNIIILYDLSCIEWKYRCISRILEKEIKEWDNCKYIIIRYNDPKFSETLIEKSKAI